MSMSLGSIFPFQASFTFQSKNYFSGIFHQKKTLASDTILKLGDLRQHIVTCTKTKFDDLLNLLTLHAVFKVFSGFVG